jgi:hypothetical protein
MKTTIRFYGSTVLYLYNLIIYRSYKNMINIKYVLGTHFGHSVSFFDNNHKIEIGGMGYNKLKVKEQDIFISDALIHEFVHALLEHMFDTTTSQLFDFIGDSLLNKTVLKKATFLLDGDRLWSDALKEEGMQYIYNNYLIDNIDLIQSYLLCNMRGK